MVLLIIIVGIVLGKTRLFTGNIGLSVSRGSACSYTGWTKVFEGSYGEIPAGGIPDDERGQLLTGITPANINSLRGLIKDGCDVKLQFIPKQIVNGITAQEAKTYTCSITTFYENPAEPNGDGWIKCRYDPYFWIATQYIGTVLYGEVLFVINNTLSPAAVQIDKGYTIKGGAPVGGQFVEDVSFFRTGWQESGVSRWGVLIFVKK